MADAVPLGNPKVGSEEWHDLRRWRVGGSEIAAILGLSPWESRLSLWLQKKRLIEPQASDPLLEWGQRIEPAVRDKFIEDHPGQWQPNPGMFASPHRNWQIANPDALNNTTETPELLEVKTAPYGDGWGDEGTDEIPVYYRAQVLQYVDVFGLDGAWVAGLIRGTDYRIYRVDRDDEDIAILRQAGEEFMTDLINHHTPDIDRHAATYQALRQLHPKIMPGRVEVDPVLAGDYMAAVIAEREAKADKEYYAAQILHMLGELRDATVDSARFAYRTHRSRNGQPGTPFLQVDRKRLSQITYPQPKTIREAINA